MNWRLPANWVKTARKSTRIWRLFAADEEDEDSGVRLLGTFRFLRLLGLLSRDVDCSTIGRGACSFNDGIGIFSSVLSIFPQLLDALVDVRNELMWRHGMNINVNWFQLHLVQVFSIHDQFPVSSTLHCFFIFRLISSASASDSQGSPLCSTCSTAFFIRFRLGFLGKINDAPSNFWIFTIKFLKSVETISCCAIRSKALASLATRSCCFASWVAVCDGVASGFASIPEIRECSPPTKTRCRLSADFQREILPLPPVCNPPRLPRFNRRRSLPRARHPAIAKSAPASFPAKCTWCKNRCSSSSPLRCSKNSLSKSASTFKSWTSRCPVGESPSERRAAELRHERIVSMSCGFEGIVPVSAASLINWMNETVDVIPVVRRSASAALAACRRAAARLASTFVGPIRFPRFWWSLWLLIVSLRPSWLKQLAGGRAAFYFN